MSPERDIERVIETWLRPGPTAMADGFFDNVLAHVERQPQRRLAWSHPRVPAMRFSTLAAAVAAIVLAVGAGLVATGRPVDRGAGLPSAQPATPVPVRATPSPSPIASAPPLTNRIDSPGYGYSITVPGGYRLYPATEAWDPFVETTMASPWLERIRTDDNVVTITARSMPLESPTTSEAWLTRFGTFPGSPAVGVTCEPTQPDWQPVDVDGIVGYQTHEPCGPTWLVVASGNRGYVFTWRPNIDDVPEVTAPYDALWARIRGAIDLTPETAAEPAADGSPAP